MSKLSASFVHAATCRARSATSNASTATLRMAEADVATALDASVAVAKDVLRTLLRRMWQLLLLLRTKTSLFGLRTSR